MSFISAVSIVTGVKCEANTCCKQHLSQDSELPMERKISFSFILNQELPTPINLHSISQWQAKISHEKTRADEPDWSPVLSIIFLEEEKNDHVVRLHYLVLY